MMTMGVMMFQFIDFSNLKTEEIFNPEDPLGLNRLAMRNPEYQRIMKIELPRMLGLGILG